MSDIPGNRNLPPSVLGWVRMECGIFFYLNHLLNFIEIDTLKYLRPTDVYILYGYYITIYYKKNKSVADSGGGG